MKKKLAFSDIELVENANSIDRKIIRRQQLCSFADQKIVTRPRSPKYRGTLGSNEK
jgi:hypothetical protein